MTGASRCRSSGGRTPVGTQCERLDRALVAERGDRQVLVLPKKAYDEESELVRYR